MNMVFLVGSYVPHQLISINSLIDNYNVNILSYSISKKFTYIPNNILGLTTKLFSDYTKEEVYNAIIAHDPKVLVAAGWMIKDYVWIAKKIKKNTKIKVVAMSDTPWYGTLKQKFNALISPFHLKNAFDYLWVAGIRQYDYARKLGFQNQQIIFNSLTANNILFDQINIHTKVTNYPKNFIYVGRFSPEKGLDVLIKAWHNIKNKKGWTLTLIGDGPLKDKFTNNDEIIVKDYMNHSDLLNEFQNAGCFVLPSLHEPWALVIHEAACAGLPIICTNVCGAAPHFVVDNYNGLQVRVNDSIDLVNKMEAIMNKTDNELISFSFNSRKLSKSINPSICTASLMQIISNK